MATAIKLRSDIKKYEAAIKSKATPEKFKAKLKSQLDKAKDELQALKSSKKPTKAPKKAEKKQSAADKLRAKYKGSGVDLKKDAERPALPIGRRTAKKSKKTYYEYRLNRLDIRQPPKRYPKLEKGGLLKKEDFVWNALGKKLIVDKITEDEYYLVGFGQSSPSPFSKEKVDNYIKKGEWTLKPKMASGGYMAEGGEIEKGDYITFKSGLTDTSHLKHKGKILKEEGSYYVVEVENDSFMFDGKKGTTHVHKKNVLSKIDKMASGGYMANGGEMHRSEEDKYAQGGMTFKESSFKDGLDEGLGHLYEGLNNIEAAMGYLDKTGQGGMKKAFAQKIGLDGLKNSIEKIDEYLTK